jgi:DHA1 family solute carrier family 18 vesicular amine transporter 1/2
VTPPVPDFLASDLCTGITTDLLAYSIIIPVIPFQLERLKYHKVSALTGWLLCAYVCITTTLLSHLLIESLTVRWAGPLCVTHSRPLLATHVLSATIPIAMYSERTTSRRTPLVIGLIALLASQVLFMEAPNYALMAIARALQGISSSMVWIVGLALLLVTSLQFDVFHTHSLRSCDTAPEKKVGRQLIFSPSTISQSASPTHLTQVNSAWQ